MESSVLLDVPVDGIMKIQIFRTIGKMIWLSSEARKLSFLGKGKHTIVLEKPWVFAFIYFTIFYS